MSGSPADPSEQTGRLLYIRLGAGIGFPLGEDISDDYASRAGDEITFSGQAFALDVMAGAQVLPWMVLGGGVVSDEIASGSVKDQDGEEEDLERSLYFAVVGAFVDIYPFPPAGFHAQLCPGLARLSLSSDLGNRTAVGFGAVLGIGYDLRVSRRWNLGALARFAFAPMSMDPIDGETREPTMLEPALLLTATFRPDDRSYATRK